jgi:hypothetical protein
MKSPLSQVKDKFGDKKALVEAVKKFTGEELWIGRTNEKKGLAHVSNAKLLKLHATFSQVKEKFGTRFKLVDAILEAENRAKDEGFRTRLLAYPVPRLWDMYNSADKRKARSPATTPKGETKKAAPKAAAPAAPAAKGKAPSKVSPAEPPAKAEKAEKAPKKKAAPKA